MKGKIIRDWSKVDFKNPDHVKKLNGAFQHFMRVPERNKELKLAMQQFTTKGDFPDNIIAVLEKYHATPDWDTGYEQIYDVRDFTGGTESGFKILDVTSGLTFSKIPVGDKIKVYKASGSVVSVEFDRYGGGLNWDRTWFDDRQYWQIEDTAIEFRNKAYSQRAAAHYALIEAGTNTTTWQGTSTDTEVNRDIKTINAAALAILTAVKDKGYGVNANTELILLAPLALMSRVNKAMTQLNQAFAGSNRSIVFTVRPIFSLMLASNSYYYVCLPKKKIKSGNRMDLTLFNLFDPLLYADTVAGWMRYGAAIGDTDQVEKCSIA